MVWSLRGVAAPHGFLEAGALIACEAQMSREKGVNLLLNGRAGCYRRTKSASRSSNHRIDEPSLA
jgi:hypothetical protein